jgi:hypothetical protein
MNNRKGGEVSNEKWEQAINPSARFQVSLIHWLYIYILLATFIFILVKKMCENPFNET